MRGIGKPPIGISIAFVLVSGVIMLAPSEASAQFNIDGIIRGAIGRNPYGYRAPTHHSSSHAISSGTSDDNAAGDNKNGKGIKSGDDNSTSNDNKASHGPGGSQAASSDTPALKSGPAGSSSGPSGAPSGGPPGASSSGPAKSSDDTPSFAPSR
jgi:hypothetical protein